MHGKLLDKYKKQVQHYTKNPAKPWHISMLVPNKHILKVSPNHDYIKEISYMSYNKNIS